ncbi:MAG: hypothetical protein JOY59_10605, partial [Candidatus Eremiobacteraeota bacterium]|nr:hypothetical protein [Candidatus Eremiobacteraeota bacterium]
MARQADIFIASQDGVFRGRVNAALANLEPSGLEGCGTVLAIAIDNRNPDRLYAATRRGGFFRSDDRGRTWDEKNDGLIYKEAWSIAQHPATGELYLGTGPAAVFKSTDFGDRWTFCEGLHRLPETKDWTFPNPPHIAHVKGLALSRTDPNVVLGAIEEGWLIRSTDGGATWKTLKSGPDFDSHTVRVMADNPRVLLSTSGNGIYRSEDLGDHFAPATEGLTRMYVAQIVAHDAEPQVLFTAAAEVPPPHWRRPEGANSKFFRSDDQGRSWQTLAGGLPAHMTAAPRSTAGR